MHLIKYQLVLLDLLFRLFILNIDYKEYTHNAPNYTTVFGFANIKYGFHHEANS